MAVMAQWNDSTLVYYIKTSLSVQALLISVFWLLVWRQWKFFISPSLYPDRPKTYPYWIPCKLDLCLVNTKFLNILQQFSAMPFLFSEMEMALLLERDCISKIPESHSSSLLWVKQSMLSHHHTTLLWYTRRSRTCLWTAG